MSNTSKTNYRVSKSSKNKVTLGIAAIGLLFYIIYLLGLIRPESWWGVHHLAFLPSAWKYGLFIIAIASAFLFRFIPFERVRLPGRDIGWVLLIGLLVGVIYYSYPIYESLYGDSEYFREKMGERTSQLLPEHVKYVFSPNVFHPKIGNLTVLGSVRALSYLMDLSHSEVYRMIDALCGIIFVVLWLFFIYRYLEDKSLKVILSIVGLLAPFTQFFFGYEEIYAPAFPIVTGYFVTLLFYFRSKKRVLLLLSGLLFFLCLKIHFVFVFLFPSFALTLLYYFASEKKWVQGLFSWRKVMYYILIPAVVCGGLAYFFILKDYNDPRFITADVDIYSRIFLPILSPPPPYDRYTVFHFNHLFDYFNMFFLWSGATLFLLVIIFSFYRKQIRWNKPEIIVTGISLLFLVLVYFMYNPLMSMPIDFDLFSLPGPVFCIFVVLLATQLQHSAFPRRVGGIVLGLSLLSTPVFMVNAHKEALSYRMQYLGEYIFKTYWIRSAGTLGAGIELLEEDGGLLISRYEATLKKLEPYTIEGDDIEYGNLLWRFARYYRTQERDYEKALYYHKKAWEYGKDFDANYIGLMEASYMLGQYKEAYSYSEKLVAFNYPTEERALKIAIQCALYAGFRDEALKHCRSYLQEWPKDDFIRNIRNGLQQNVDMQQLRSFFSG